MKKNVVKVMIIMTMLMLFTSCAKNKNYEQYIKKTKEAIAEKKIEQAEGFIELAVETNPKKQEAKNYQKQIEMYLESFDYKEKKDYNNAVIKLDKVIKITNASDKMIAYAEEEKVVIEAEKNGGTDNSETVDKGDSEALWSTKKTEELQSFMSDFSNMMGQSYKEYTPLNSVDLYGVQLPDDIINGQWTMAINEQPIQFDWSESGKGENPYQLVAVYSDADTQPYLEKHVYFFMIEDGVPKVYVTQQNQGNNQNYLYFSETQNQSLNNGFSGIVKEK